MSHRVSRKGGSKTQVPAASCRHGAGSKYGSLLSPQAGRQEVKGGQGKPHLMQSCQTEQFLSDLGAGMQGNSLSEPVRGLASAGRRTLLIVLAQHSPAWIIDRLHPMLSRVLELPPQYGTTAAHRHCCGGAVVCCGCKGELRQPGEAGQAGNNLQAAVLGVQVQLLKLREVTNPSVNLRRSNRPAHTYGRASAPGCMPVPVGTTRTQRAMPCCPGADWPG